MHARTCELEHTEHLDRHKAGMLGEVLSGGVPGRIEASALPFDLTGTPKAEDGAMYSLGGRTAHCMQVSNRGAP